MSGMGRRKKVKSRAQSAFTGWRHVMFWQRDELKKEKRFNNKRERQEAIRKIRDGAP